MVEYLSEEQILYLHESLTAATGGAAGVRDQNALQAAIARPAASFGGQDLYETLTAKAAAFMESLISNHPFVDGNKRVAIAATELFLLANGVSLAADTDALEELTMAAASSRVAVEEIRIWLEQHVRSG